MLSLGDFLGLLAVLYYACFLLFTALSVFIAVGARDTGRSDLRRTFILLAGALLVWQVTLFAEVRVVSASVDLWLGRVNFAIVAVAVYLALQFVRLVPLRVGEATAPVSAVLVAETAAVTTATLLTPLVDSSERVEAGLAISSYGELFPLYLVHVAAFLVAAVVIALRKRRRDDDARTRAQLVVIGVALVTTSTIALVTNALLPYVLHDFRFCDVGPLSTVLFGLAVAYCTFIHRLFDLRYVVRETLVYGVMLAFVLGVYTSGVFVATQYLTGSSGKATQFVVLLIAFSFDPLRRFLEKKADRLLFGGGDADAGEQTAVESPDRERTGSFRLLMSLFPWRPQ